MSGTSLLAMLISMVMFISLCSALPTQTDDELLVEGRKLISEALKKQTSETLRTYRKMLHKSRSKCQEKLFQNCTHDSNCRGCPLKCQIYPNGTGRCTPVTSSLLMRRAFMKS